MVQVVLLSVSGFSLALLAFKQLEVKPSEMSGYLLLLAWLLKWKLIDVKYSCGLSAGLQNTLTWGQLWGIMALILAFKDPIGAFLLIPASCKNIPV